MWIDQKRLVENLKKEVKQAIDLRKDNVNLKLVDNFRGSIHEIKYIEEMFHVKQIEAELQEYFIRYIIKASVILKVEGGRGTVYLQVDFKRK